MDETLTEAPIAPHAGPMGRAAGILFFTPEGEVLLLRRGDGGDFPQTFGLPGGHVEPGETDEEAARRECLEETGFNYTGPLVRLCSDGQFVTFIAREVAQFGVTLCDESTGFVWTRPESAPQPLHPGMDAAFRVASAHTELDVARLIRDGVLPSPQVFNNCMLFALRITGTGQAYRSKSEEWAHRDPSFYLNDEFLARCNGLPVVWQHPEKLKLDTKSYAETNIGAMLLPYIKADEVWGIARVLDMVAGLEMAKPGAEWSTSPGVLFDDASQNVKVALDGGEKVLVEGNPFLIDHLAICERGVWDKEGPSEGVQVDQPIEVNMSEIVAGESATADSQADTPSLSAIMAAVQGLVGTMKGVTSRMDSMEKNMPAPVMNDARADSEEVARKDAEEKEKAEKIKADSEAAEKKKDEEAAADAAKCDEDEAAMADAQAVADSVYQQFNKRAPRALSGETLMAYRKRLIRPMQPHSAAWKGADLTAINDSVAFGIAETAIYADAAAASRHVGVEGRSLRAIRTRDESTGHNVTTFAGAAGAWMDDFRAPTRELVRINKESQQ